MARSDYTRPDGTCIPHGGPFGDCRRCADQIRALHEREGLDELRRDVAREQYAERIRSEGS